MNNLAGEAATTQPWDLVTEPDWRSLELPDDETFARATAALDQCTLRAVHYPRRSAAARQPLRRTHRFRPLHAIAQ